jgi:hypothetical protein
MWESREKAGDNTLSISRSPPNSLFDQLKKEVKKAASLKAVRETFLHCLPGAPRMKTMSNPWLFIPLEDYEGHMGPAGVQQLRVLAELFKCALDGCLPESVAVLGIAGGNGLELIDCQSTKRIVGVDINRRYLDEVQRRFGTLCGLELHCRDLAQREFSLAPVALVHAALIFEHVGLGLALENALSLVAPGGRFSVVLQLPGEEEQGVASTIYTSMQKLKQDFALIDISEFRGLLERKGFQLVEQENRSLPAGKALWLGVFAKNAVTPVLAPSIING